jgi:hypothetical protein
MLHLLTDLGGDHTSMAVGAVGIRVASFDYQNQPLGWFLEVSLTRDNQAKVAGASIKQRKS